SVVVGAAMEHVTVRAELALDHGDEDAAVRMLAVACVLLGHPLAASLGDWSEWKAAVERLAPVARFLAGATLPPVDVTESGVYRVLRETHARLVRQRVQVAGAQEASA